MKKQKCIILLLNLQLISFGKQLNIGMNRIGREGLLLATRKQSSFNTNAAVCGVFILVNFGLDTVEQVPFANFPADIKKVENLEPDGSWKEIQFKDGVIDLKLQCMDIAILRFTKK